MLVGFSNEEIGTSVCTWLHQRGYRRPALISGQDERAQRRNASFLRQARALGMDADIPVCLTPAPTTLGAGRATLARLLERPGGVDAVFCSSDMLALGVMMESQARGLRVPGQLGVVGLGDLEFATDLQPALTTVRIDGTRIGETAARYIVDRVEGRTVEQPILDIGFSIIERQSA
jgi:LacI family gluconate utilization system Gnt-I transcriptional repressor